MRNYLNKFESKKWRIELPIESNSKIIKSFYILKEIFSFLNIKRKLDIIIYNKNLQNKLGIDIEDYKNISGIYKIGEKNGKGSEYMLNTNILIYEGEYINGKRNGKGKEYNDNFLKEIVDYYFYVNF